MTASAATGGMTPEWALAGGWLLKAGRGWGEAVVVDAAWVSVIGSAVTAIAAFGGVMLAQRATRMRDLEVRIWESRSRVYEELVRWALVISHAVDDLPPAGPGGEPHLSEGQARALLPAPELEARVTAYASAAILREFRRCCFLLSRPPGRRDMALDALMAVSSLGDDIRKELRTGREQQEPLAFRISVAWTAARVVMFPSPRRWRSWHGYRRLEQDDDVLLLASQDTMRETP